MPSAAVRQGEALSREFEELYLEHCQLVYRTAYAITDHCQDAEDVLQRIFVNLLERGLTPDVLEHPAGYLHRAAVNMSLNVVRERRRRMSAADPSVLEIQASSGETLHEVRGREERHERLMTAMASLQPRALEILLLRYKHDYSDAQIAELLGTSRGVVAVTLYRIRGRLRTLMRAEDAQGDRT